MVFRALTRPVRAGRTPLRRRPRVVAGAAAALALTTAAAGVLASATAAPAATPRASASGPALGRAVTYAGLSVRVPAAWPVYDLTAHPTTCVRWDRHAVYVGAPGTSQDCPAHLVGRTEAVLLAPATGTAGAGVAARPDSPMVTAAAGTVPAAAVSAVSHQIGVAATGSGAQLTVTWGSDRALATRIAAGATRRSIVAAPLGAAQVVPQYPVGATSTMLRGKAFDTCAAPSVAAMAAWRHSPFTGAAVYIGGVNRACGDGNLSPSWMSTVVTSERWKVLPLYVGLQAPCSSSVFARVSYDPATAFGEGVSEAADAVANARSFGLQAGSAVYSDMEGYYTSGPCSAGVLSYLSGWTSGLHAAGFLAGVYSSGGSGIYDLGQNFWNPSYLMPDLVWIARWDGIATTAEHNLAATQWSGHQRVKQYVGDHYESWSGARIDIDSDIVDSAVSTIGYRVLVVRTTHSLSRPVSSATPRTALPANVAVGTTCWLSGSRVGSSNTWFELTDGSFVPQADVNLRGRTPPRCGLFYTTWTTIPARRGPGANFPIVLTIPGGNGVWVTCQAAGLKVRTSIVWDRLRSGLWVSDYWMNTPGHHTFSPAIPRC